ncbi:MAG: S8 family serine peptidase [Gammaproteobacteria bacterium]|nr:S8 family serine peptidase [Gammaproteobacteria bacterium]
MDIKIRRLSSLFVISLLFTACSGSADPEPLSYSVSGTVSIQPNTFIDSDVNDSYAPGSYHKDNNSFDFAQQIENPAKVGGYVNMPLSGPPPYPADGASYESGDINDYYRVNLAASENIRLYIADAVAGDLNLSLIAADKTTILGTSNSGTSVEEILNVAECIQCYIHVEVIDGYSNYLLTVGNTGIASYSSQDIFYDNFIPDELIVRFKNKNITTAYSHFQNTTGISNKVNLFGGAALVNFSGQRDVVRQKLGLIAAGNKAQGINASRVTTEARSKRETLQVLKALRSRDDIASVDVNYIRKPTVLPDTNTYYNRLWHYDSINMPTVWNEGSITGAGRIVAVIDTGVRLNHPDLAGQFVNGYDFISDPVNALDGNGIDSNPEDPGDAYGTPYRSSFHGTHVAGTIAALDNNQGIVGVAYNSKIMPLRVLGKYGGTDADIIQAMRFAAGLSNSSLTLPAIKADVINMSLGGPGYSSAVQATVNEVYAAGVIIIAAAGNESSSATSYPAGYTGVVSVSAVDQNNILAPYSNYGTRIDVAAPGGNTSADADGDGNPDGVLSTVADDSGAGIVDTYVYYQGTSMAAPHVAAVVALMKEANPAMTPLNFDTWLPSIVDDLGTVGKDTLYGYGLINAAKALNVANGSITFPASIAVTPSEVVFTAGMTGTTMSVENSGTDPFTNPLTVSTVTYLSGVDWLTVTESSVDPTSKLGTYQLTVSRDALPDGEYNAHFTLSSSGVADVVVSVTMKVGFVGSEDAGYHYFAIYNAQTLQDVGYMEASPIGGVYHYSFSGIPAGEYFISAGTDMDNDYYFCNLGEACGSYSNVPLLVNRNLTGMDFVTSFDIPVTGLSMPAATGSVVRRGYPKR